MILLTPYVPIVNTNIAKYLTPVFKVAQPRTKPAIAINFETVMCHVRSLKRPEEIDQAMDIAPAIRYGGQVRTSVIVVLKPSVLADINILLSSQEGNTLLNDCWEEVFESVGSKVHVLHESKHPHSVVRHGFLQSSECRRLLTFTYCLASDAIKSKLSLIGGKPLRSKRFVGKSENRSNRDHECDSAL